MSNPQNPLTLTLYVNTDDEKYIDKSLNQQFKLTDVYLKEGTSVLNPTFTFRKFKKNNTWVWKNFNYARCEFGAGDKKTMKDRFYYVRDLVLQPGGIVEIICEEDVRYTWRDYIKAQKFLISRQEHKYNRVVADNRRVVPLARQIDTHSIGTVGDGGDGSIILTISGN